MSERKFSFLNFKISFDIACFSFLVRFFFLHRKQKEKMNVKKKDLLIRYKYLKNH